MKKSTIVSGLGASLLLCSIACEKEGLTDGGGSGGFLQGGSGLGGVGLGGAVGSGGAIGVGGLMGLGGTTGAGGLLGSGGLAGTGGKIGSGGAVATGGVASSGGVVTAGGATGTGGKTGAGGIQSTGGTSAFGGSIGAGGATGVGGKTGAGGATAAGGGTGVGGKTGTGGGTGRTCSILGSNVCPPDQFCELSIGACLITGEVTGVCTLVGSGMCPMNYAPVCGCDGVTYGNDCSRQAAAVSKAADGECATKSPCPTDISQITTWPCTEGLTCEYGTDPRPGCRASATCTNGTWTVTQAKCTQLPPVTCPATRESAAGQTCPTDGAYCVYGDLSCACNNCRDGSVVVCEGALTWHCQTPNADATCPAGIPLLGTACTTDGKTCTYACGTGGARLCKKGAWYSADGGPCPVSARREKKDIVYIGQAERERIASDLARFKLATYEYRDPTLAGKRHLGFIIDDVPGSPAVDRDGNMVDLYGYASMLVAAVQAQGEEIACLKAELAKMKAKAMKAKRRSK
jgi:hypothetical protein